MPKRVMFHTLVEATDIIDSSEQVDGIRAKEDHEAPEPCLGIEFGSEDDARKFYDSYAQKAGFVIHAMQSRHSEADEKTLILHCIGCNYKQISLSPNLETENGPEIEKTSSIPSSREQCTAAILLKLDEDGKWKVTKFVKDHNHPLAATSPKYTDLIDKYKKIQELAEELKRQDTIAAAYRERLINLLTDVEKQADHLSSKVLAVVQSVKKAEAEALITTVKP